MEDRWSLLSKRRSRDRDLGVRSAAANGAATRHAPIRVRSAHAVARAPDQQLEAARSARPLEPLICGSGYDGMENLEGNRFGGDEFCQSCAQPHVDSNYVATDANGVTYCGDCWDATPRSLGVTIIAECALALGTDLCACGKELRTERWFAVECTPAQEAFCQACSLNFWGFTAVKDSRITRPERQERGAHLQPEFVDAQRRHLASGRTVRSGIFTWPSAKHTWGLHEPLTWTRPGATAEQATIALGR